MDPVLGPLTLGSPKRALPIVRGVRSICGSWLSRGSAGLLGRFAGQSCDGVPEALVLRVLCGVSWS